MKSWVIAGLVLGLSTFVTACSDDSAAGASVAAEGASNIDGSALIDGDQDQSSGTSDLIESEESGDESSSLRTKGNEDAGDGESDQSEDDGFSAPDIDETDAEEEPKDTGNDSVDNDTNAEDVGEDAESGGEGDADVIAKDDSDAGSTDDASNTDDAGIDEDGTAGADTLDGEDAEVEEEDVYVPPVFACKKDGDCMLQFPNVGACEKATCDLETGDCGVTVLIDDSECSDGDPCSLGDRCVTGACMPLTTNCDDDNICTNDVCFPGLACVNEKNLDPCDDGDKCTSDDHCLGTKCIGDPLDCDDQDLCTNDFCVEGGCQHQLVQDENCCFVDVNQWKFTEGSFGGWLPLNPQEDVGWTVSELNSSSVPYALYYGNEDTQDYDTAGAPNSGLITSQPTLLPTAGAITFSFQAYLDVDLSSSADKFYLYLFDEEGTKHPLWHKTSSTPQSVFYEHQVDVTAFSGQVVQFQFMFDTITADSNSGLGVFVDDIYVFSKCPEETCEVDADCEDEFICTIDSCVDGLCKHDVAEGCCTSDFQCDDDDVCTNDICEDFVCTNVNNEASCNDGDKCSVKDTCVEGTCIGEPKNCNDKYACSIDSCVDGVCVFVASEDEGCCDISLADFENDTGELIGWTPYTPTNALEPNNAVPGSWEVNNFVATSFPYSFAVGDGDTYGTEDSATIYGIESDMIDLPLTVDLQLQFWLYLDVDTSDIVDTFRIEGTSPTGKVQTIWEKPLNFPMKKWTYIKADASFFTSEGGVQIGMVFNTQTPGIRLLQGVHIDDLRLYAPCSPEPCDPNYVAPVEEGGEEEGGEEEGGEEEGGDEIDASTDADSKDDASEADGVDAEEPEPVLEGCDESDPSVFVTCSEEGLCEEEPKLWYCEDDSDCDDLKLCTESKCFFNTCQFVNIPNCCEGIDECDDGNICTSDTCGGLDGCSYDFNTFACDDNDGCTENDVCAEGVCGGSAVDCDDGTGCSVGECSEDVCSYTYVDAPGCCGFDKATYLNEEEATLDQWVIDGNNPDSKWQISSAKFTTPPFSLYYGDPATQDYDAGTNAGTALSPAVWLPNAIETVATMNMYIDVEEDLEFDQVSISAVVEGDVDNPILMWEKSEDTQLQLFHEVELSLSEHAGKSVQLLFSFDTVDGTTNTREGVYIDSLVFHVKCPPTPCNPLGDLTVCDDGIACTTDTCIPGASPEGGVCSNVNQPGCCSVSEDCNDFNFCTTDSCVGGVCTFEVEEGCCFSSADCEDGNACTTDICDPLEGCLQELNTDFCSDGDPCTKNDLCSEGTCAGVPLDCNDGDDVCTDDSCKQGVCIFAPTGADGCCETDEDCNDNDDCTINTCVEGSCNTVNTCCFSDAECDDGDDVCTNDQCVGGDCVYQPTGAPGCCEPIVYSQSFPNTDSAGFIFNGTNFSSKWQVFDGGKSQSAPAALYYGNPAALNFNSGVSSGSATSPVISLPNKDGITLEFWAYMDTEASSVYDKLFLYLKNGPSSSTIWQKSNYTSTGMKLWSKQVVNLNNYKGQNIQLEWFFNSVDPILNSGEGVYIDDIQVIQTCP